MYLYSFSLYINIHIYTHTYIYMHYHNTKDIIMKSDNYAKNIKCMGELQSNTTLFDVWIPTGGSSR